MACDIRDQPVGRVARVLGVVMNQFRAEPNRYLTDKVASAHFYERLQNLITRSVGFVAILVVLTLRPRGLLGERAF